MKKTYINPEIEIVCAETQELIATSVGFGAPLSGNNAAAPEFDDEIEF